VSRGTAIIMIIMYLFYLYFQLRSHTHLFQEDVGEENDSEAGDPQDAAQKESQKSGEILGPTGAVVCLVLTTIFVGLSAEFLVNSIEDVVEQTGMTTTFIGIIILPIISNAAEHVTAVIVS
jgi:Ca2+:H+ antiporter